MEVEVRETVAARGLVNGRGPQSGRDSVSRTSFSIYEKLPYRAFK